MSEKEPKILENFLNYLIAIKNYSIKTTKGYEINLMEFFNFIKSYCKIEAEVSEFNVFILSHVNEDDIIAYLVYCNMTKDNSSATRRRKLSAIKTFYNWLFKKYSNFCTMQKPTEDLPIVQETQRFPKYLNLEQSKKIINCFNIQNSKNPIRNNAIISLMINCGLRCSEAINLNISDINFKDRKIFVINGKGNKDRTVYINNNVESHLMKYLAYRKSKEKILDVSKPLFISNRQEKMKLQDIETICTNAFRIIGITDKRYTAHSLRHTAAMLAYQYEGADILVIKELLGHSSILSTEIYTHLYNEKVKNAFYSNPLSNFGIDSKAA